jgi:RNA polymerase sigma-70 factor (ECF subfamily)
MKILPILSNLQDEELLSLINSGNQQAFVCIYDRYWSEMYTCAFQIFPHRETCEDLIHDVFLYLWNSKELLQIRSVRDYLYIAVKNRSLNKIRSKHSHVGIIDEGHNNIPSDISSDENLAVKEIKEVFEAAISELPDKCKEILIMSRKEHLSNKEIASKLGISPKTVENQINIGLKKIRLGMTEFLVFYFIYFFFG